MEAKVKKVPFHRMKAYGWSRGIAPLIFNLGTNGMFGDIMRVTEMGWLVVTGLIWLGLEICGVLLWARKLMLVFHRIRGIS